MLTSLSGRTHQVYTGVTLIRDGVRRTEHEVTAVTFRSHVPYTVRPGDRIAQLAVVPVVQARLVPVEDLGETARGTGGFGSTGL